MKHNASCISYLLSLICSSHRSSPCRPTLSYQRLQTEQPLSDRELYDRIRRTVPNKQDVQVLESFLIFNKCVYFSPFVRLPDVTQTRSQDKLLPAHESCVVLPSCTRVSS